MPIGDNSGTNQAPSITRQEVFAQVANIFNVIAGFFNSVTQSITASTLVLQAIVPASPAPGTIYLGGGRYGNFISSTDLTGSGGTIALPGDTRYSSIIGKIRRAIPSTADLLELQFNAGAGIDTGANYTWDAFHSGAHVSGVGVAFVSLSAGINVHATLGSGFTGWFEIFDPGDITGNKWLTYGGSYVDNGGTNVQFVQGGGRYFGAATALTQLKLFYAANMFTSGFCDLFGVIVG